MDSRLRGNDGFSGVDDIFIASERIDFSLGLCSREQKTFAIIFVDLDRFKQINDSLGHLFGDRVLVEVAQRIKSCLRHSDTAARTGGDEFVLLLHDTDAVDAETFVRRVRHRLCEPVVLDDLSLTVTANIGIALYPSDGSSKNELIKNAGTAMYQVKERERSGFRFYQPQIDLATSRIIGAEALLRWSNQELGEVSPARWARPACGPTGRNSNSPSRS